MAHRTLLCFPGAPVTRWTRCMVIDREEMRINGPTGPRTIVKILPWPNKSGTWNTRTMNTLAQEHGCDRVRVVETIIEGRIGIRRTNEWVTFSPYGLAVPPMADEDRARTADPQG